MTELSHGRPHTMQLGGFTVEARPFVDLAPGTEMVIRPALLQEDIEKLSTNSVNAYVSELEDLNASRVFLTGNHAEQAGFSTREDGSLTPVGVRGLLRILSPEDEE